jgi:ATP-binding cassette subfamily B protein
LALRDLVSVGVIATFVVYVRTFFRPMRTIAMLYNQLQSTIAGAAIIQRLEHRLAGLQQPR